MAVHAEGIAQQEEHERFKSQRDLVMICVAFYSGRIYIGFLIAALMLPSPTSALPLTV